MITIYLKNPDFSGSKKDFFSNTFSVPNNISESYIYLIVEFGKLLTVSRRLHGILFRGWQGWGGGADGRAWMGGEANTL